MEWALTKSFWMLLQKTTSPQFISQAALFNSRWQLFLLFFNIIFEFVFFFHLILFYISELFHIIFFKEGPFNFIIYFWRNFIIFLSLIYLISISFNYHNLANIFIHAVIGWHQIFLFLFFNLTNTHTHINV